MRQPIEIDAPMETADGGRGVPGGYLRALATRLVRAHHHSQVVER